jgi:F-type H+-transporting ATPase subunit b
VKRLLRRSVLVGLTLALVLGLGLHLRETRVRAQTAEASRQETAAAASAPEKAASAPEKNQQEQNEDDQYLKSPSVVWLGKKLGISTDMASNLSVVGNFVLLAIGVAWLVVKLLPKTIRDRNATIQKNLVDARTATEEARGRLSGVEERLGKLDGEIAAMRAHAEQDSSTAEQRIKATVVDEKVKILAAAEQEITAATTHAQKKLQQYAAGLAIEQAAHKLVVSAETDRLLVQGFAERLTGDDSKKGQN